MKICRAWLAVCITLALPAVAQQPAGKTKALCGAPAKLACAQTPGVYVGVVRDSSGANCFVQSGNSRPKPAARMKQLYAGDAVECFCDSTITLSLLTGEDQCTKTSLAAADGCFALSSLATQQASKKPQDCNKVETATLMSYHSDPGGPARGETSPIYSPASDGSAVPGDFAIRWSPVSEESFTFSVWDEDGVKLWPAANAGATGRVATSQLKLEDASLRTALVEFRARGGDGTLELQVNDSSGNTYRIRFTLVSQHSEEVLNRELGECSSSEQNVFLHVCRAGVYRKFNLFPEVAQQYDEAVQLVPNSEDLLQNAIGVNERTGNSKRVAELKAQLQKVAAAQ